MLLDSQSKPSYRPSPDVAHVLWMYLQRKQQCLRLTLHMSLHTRPLLCIEDYVSSIHVAKRLYRSFNSHEPT